MGRVVRVPVTSELVLGSSNCYVVLWKGRGSAYLFLDAFGSVMCCAFLPQVKFEQYPNLIFSSRVTLWLHLPWSDPYVDGAKCDGFT